MTQHVGKTATKMVVADEDDAFPNEKSQTMDTDGDGYGDDANWLKPRCIPE